MSTRPTCALVLLCVVQGCERFAFMAMLPLFVLYLHHRRGFSEPSALLLIGVFQALSYFGGLPGGALTDRKLGAKTAIILGSALLALGYSVLALDRGSLLWPALGLLIAGHSFFKPSISALLGALFTSTDARQERSFLWQYLAINLGAMTGPLCAEWAGVGHHWDRLFLVAAAAMLVGAFTISVGIRLVPSGESLTLARSSAAISSEEDRERRSAVWLICALAIVIWLTSQQASSSLTLFAESHTDRSLAVFGGSMAIGPARFASLHGLLVLALLPLFMVITARFRRRGTDPSTPVKMVWGYVATAAAFALLAAAGLRGADSSRVSPAWLGCCYLLLSIAELLLGPLGMSLLTRVAPPQRTAQAVGLWYAAAAVGNIGVGALGLLWGHWTNHCYFALLALLSLGAAVVLFTRVDWLGRLLSPSAAHGNGGAP